MSQIFFCLLPGVNGYGSVCHEPFPITNISSRFFRRRGEGCHFRFRGPANHLASTFLLPTGQAILLGLLDVTQVRLLLIQRAVTPLPSSQWDITWQYIVTQTHPHSHTHIYLCSQSLTHILTHTYACIYIHVYTYIYVYIYIYIYTHTHMYIQIHSHTRAHTHIYIYIHSHTYLYTQAYSHSQILSSPQLSHNDSL